MADAGMAQVAARVAGLDHVNLATRDLDATVAFYVAALGLEERDPPPIVSRDRARWMCDATGHPILHLQRAEPDDGPTGAFRHFALRCHGKAAMAERLTRAGIEYGRYDSADFTQITFRDPHGIDVELNFQDD